MALKLKSYQRDKRIRLHEYTDYVIYDYKMMSIREQFCRMEK